jgi:hypothetical protein
MCPEVISQCNNSPTLPPDVVLEQTLNTFQTPFQILILISLLVLAIILGFVVNRIADN